MPDRGKWAFFEHEVVATLDGFIVRVRGNDVTINITTRDGIATIERTVRSYGEPVYSSLEGFLRRAGDDARIGVIFYKDAGPVLCLYNGAPPSVMSVEEAIRLGIDPEEREEYYDGGCFGFIINVKYEMFDEIGTAPFPLNTETQEQYQERVEAQRRSWMSVFGGEENVTVIDANPNERVLGVVYDDSQG